MALKPRGASAVIPDGSGLVHMLKMAVGVTDIADLRQWQAGRVRQVDGRDVVPGYTRRRPRRVADVTGGGSLYWIIGGLIQVRQRVLGLLEERDEEGLLFCRILFDPVLVPTEPVPRRAMQGWRYLVPGDAPPDLGTAAAPAALPAELAAELSRLGIF